MTHLAAYSLEAVYVNLSHIAAAAPSWSAGIIGNRRLCAALGEHSQFRERSLQITYVMTSYSSCAYNSMSTTYPFVQVYYCFYVLLTS